MSFASFRDFVPSLGNAAGIAGASGDRSRSPTRGSAMAAASTPPWTTERPGCDDWIKRNVADPGVLEKLAELPVAKRRQLVLTCIDKKVQNPDAWLFSCCRNYRLDEAEKRLTGVDRFGMPVNSHGPPGVSTSGWGGSPTMAASGVSPRGAASPPACSPAMDMMQQTKPPQWAREAFRAWPGDKSSLIAAVMDNLNREEADAFAELDPVTMSALAMALTLAAPDVESGASKVLAQWLKRRDAFTTLAPSVSFGAAVASCTAAPIVIQLIMVGNADVRGTLLSTLTSRVVTKMDHTANVQFCKPIVLAETDEQIKDITSLETACALVESDSTRTWSEMHALMEREAEKWKEQQRRFVVVSMLSPTAQLMEDQKSGSDRGLHGPGSRWIFPAAQMTAVIAKAVGPEYVASVTFAPRDMNAKSQDLLTKFFGAQIERALPKTASPGNEPAVYAIPRETVWSEVLESKALNPEWDGWKVPSAMMNLQDNGVNLATSAMRLMVIDMFKERALADGEKALMMSVRAQHCQTGELRALPREWWFSVYGLSETPVPSFYKEKYKCACTIISATGMPARSTGSGVPCGRDRYCMQCEKTLKMMDAGYNMNALVNGVVSVITKAVSSWRRGGQATLFNREIAAEMDHACGDDCVQFASLAA